MDLIEFHRFVTPCFPCNKRTLGDLRVPHFPPYSGPQIIIHQLEARFLLRGFPYNDNAHEISICHWKFTIFHRRYIFKWLFFHCNLSFCQGVYHSAHVTVLCPESDGTFCRKRRRWVAEKRPLRLLCAPWRGSNRNRWGSSEGVEGFMRWNIWKPGNIWIFCCHMPHYEWKLRIVISQYLTQNQAVKLQFW